VAQVFYLVLSQHALFAVEYHTMLLQSGKGGVQVLYVLSVAPACHQDIVHIDKNVWHVLKDFIHKSLEGLTRVPEPKRHPQVLKQPEGGDHSRLRHVAWVDRNLMIAFA